MCYDYGEYLTTEKRFCSGKICFSYREAHEVLAAARRSRSKIIPKRCYFCKVCKQYHLTSQVKKTRRI